MTQLTFKDIAQIVKNTIGGKQSEIVNKVFNWAFIDSKPVSQPTANRYFHGESISSYIKDNKLRPLNDIEERLSKAFTYERSQLLKDELKNCGLTDGQKNIFPSSATKVLAKQLHSLLKNPISQNSSKFLQSSKSLQKKKASPKTENSALATLRRSFNSRFPNSDEYEHEFSVFVSDNVSKYKSDYSFKISNNDWKSVKQSFNCSPIVLARTLYTPEDPVKDINHPYGEFADEQLECQYNENILTSNTIKINGTEYYVDENGKKHKRFYTVKEVNPPIPPYAYIGEVTNYTFSTSASNVTVNFTFNLLNQVKYEIISQNHQYLGIPKEILLNNDHHYKHIKDIDILNRLGNVLNTTN